MNHFLRIQIRDLFLHSVGTLHSILKAILLARRQTGEGDPEIITVLIELMRRIQFPIGHITDEEHALGGIGLAGCVGAERD